MLFSGRSDCTINGWETDVAFYESGTRSSGDKSISPVAQATPMLQAYTPHRMMLYPYYDGRARGWELAYTFRTHSRYHLASSNEISYLQVYSKHHGVIHSKIPMATASGSTFRCVQDLIQVWGHSNLDRSTPYTIDASKNSR